MARQLAVGDDLYIFHGNEGRSEFLVISSHGETLARSFTVPARTKLLYYAPRDQILQMHANFRLGIRVEEEIIGGQTSPDYGLSKFQGAKRGGGAETYDSIKASIDSTRRLIGEGVQTFDQFVASAGPLPKGVTAEQLQPQFKSYLDQKANLLPMDVLTIRAKGLRSIGYGNVRLSTVLETLKQNNIFYPYIFCSFCRYTKGINKTHTTVGY